MNSATVEEAIAAIELQLTEPEVYGDHEKVQQFKLSAARPTGTAGRADAGLGRSDNRSRGTE